MNKLTSLFLFTLLVVTFQSCRNSVTESQTNQPDQKIQAQIDSLKKVIKQLDIQTHPGIGPVMLVIQTHHAKLGLAMNKNNWELSGFELEEVEEDFIQLSDMYKTFKGFKQPTEEYVKQYIAPAVEQLSEAVKNKDIQQMKRSYTLLTNGCNSCHRETSHPQNVIIEPQQNGFPDQEFGVEK